MAKTTGSHVSQTLSENPGSTSSAIRVRFPRGTSGGNRAAGGPSGALPNPTLSHPPSRPVGAIWCLVARHLCESVSSSSSSTEATASASRSCARAAAAAAGGALVLTTTQIAACRARDPGRSCGRGGGGRRARRLPSASGPPPPPPPPISGTLPVPLPSHPPNRPMGRDDLLCAPLV